MEVILSSFLVLASTITIPTTLSGTRSKTLVPLHAGIYERDPSNPSQGRPSRDPALGPCSFNEIHTLSPGEATDLSSGLPPSTSFDGL